MNKKYLGCGILVLIASVCIASNSVLKCGDCIDEYDNAQSLGDETYDCPDVSCESAKGTVFTISPISDELFNRIYGKSLKENATISRDDLRYLQVTHYDGEGNERLGEMICNKSVAEELIEIFKQLYNAKYPIERMKLVDDFDADDETSMRANNTSCFNYRAVAGTKVLSAHSRGTAIDINPLYNPCVRTRNGKRIIEPSTAGKYADRSKVFKYKIDRRDLAYKLFTERGYKWGGDWRTVKDYQHFEK